MGQRDSGTVALVDGLEKSVAIEPLGEAEVLIAHEFGPGAEVVRLGNIDIRWLVGERVRHDLVSNQGRASKMMPSL